MSNKEINQLLADLGLSNAEAKVYLACLELGSQPASVIAKKSALKRGQTYNILERLIQKGIIQSFIKDKIRYFSSRPPNTLITILEHQEDELKIKKQKLLQAIPMLEKIINPLLIQPKVRFFQGVEGIQEIYEDTLRTPEHNVYALGDFDFMFPEEQVGKYHYDWLWKYCVRRAKKGISFIGIINKSKHSDLAYKKRKEQKRELKMLKNVYLPVEMNIYGNKVALMSTYKDVVGLIIEDAPIAETMRNLHQAVWPYLPEYKLQ